MPCFERFERQPESYRNEVLPNECRKRVAIEAGVPEIWSQIRWARWQIIGLHRFGLSAPGAEVMKEFGIDAEHVIKAARVVRLITPIPALELDSVYRIGLHHWQ